MQQNVNKIITNPLSIIACIGFIVYGTPCSAESNLKTIDTQSLQAVNPEMTINAEFPSGYVYGANKKSIKFTGTVTNCGLTCSIRGKVYNASKLDQSNFEKLVGNEILQGTEEARRYSFEWECPLNHDDVFTDCMIEVRRGIFLDRQIFSYISGNAATPGDSLPAVLDLHLTQNAFNFIKSEASSFIDKFQKDLIYGWDSPLGSHDPSSPWKDLPPLLPIEPSPVLHSRAPNYPIGGIPSAGSNTILRMYPKWSTPPKEKNILIPYDVRKKKNAPIPSDQSGVVNVGPTDLSLELNKSSNTLDLSMHLDGQKGIDPTDRNREAAIFFQGQLQKTILSPLPSAVAHKRCLAELGKFSIKDVGLAFKIDKPRGDCRYSGQNSDVENEKNRLMLSLESAKTKLSLDSKLLKLHCDMGVAEVANSLPIFLTNAIANYFLPKRMPSCVNILDVDKIFDKVNAPIYYNGPSLLNVSEVGGQRKSWTSLNIKVTEARNPLVPTLRVFRKASSGWYSNSNHLEKIKNFKLNAGGNAAIDIREDILNYAAFRIVQERIFDDFVIANLKNVLPGLSLRSIRNRIDRLSLTLKTPPVFTFEDGSIVMHVRNLMVGIKGKDDSDYVSFAMGADVALKAGLVIGDNGDDFLQFSLDAKHTDFLPTVKMSGVALFDTLNKRGNLDALITWAVEHFTNQLRIPVPELDIPRMPDAAVAKIKKINIGNEVNSEAPPSIYAEIEIKRK